MIAPGGRRSRNRRRGRTPSPPPAAAGQRRARPGPLALATCCGAVTREAGNLRIRRWPLGS
eukprot:10315955-Lingulodinium_polyedra.AAC.1